MLKVLIVFSLFSLFLGSDLNANESSPGLASSIANVLKLESEAICNSSNSEELATNYISRGESHLLLGNFNEAFLDYEHAYSLVQTLNPNDENLTRTFRSLFGLTLCLVEADREDEANDCLMQMQDILHSVSCDNCHQKSHGNDYQVMNAKHQIGLNNTRNFYLIANNAPILGPDTISIQDCIERAEGTAKMARLLIMKAGIKAQFALSIIIDSLESQAIRCCRAGGIWKSCLQPIVNKWSNWSEKWKAFGIPPDPAWD